MMPAVKQHYDQKNQEPDSKIAEIFYDWFDVIAADTIALRERVYQLRYQVYCMERRFEDPQAHPHGQETDEFDAHSVHTLLLDRSRNIFVGAVRLILPNNDVAYQSFPMQRVCRIEHLLTDSCAEISRFAISRDYRRIEAVLQQEKESTAEMRLAMSCIALGLMRGVMSMSLRHGITDVFAVMEPAFLRLLNRVGINFQKVGSPVEYHGIRQPCHGNIQEMLTGIRKKRPYLLSIISKESILTDKAERPLTHAFGRPTDFPAQPRQGACDQAFPLKPGALNPMVAGSHWPAITVGRTTAAEKLQGIEAPHI